MAQAAGDGADVDAGCDELGRRVVAQAVQVRVDAEPLRQPAVPLGHRVGLRPLRAVGRRREHEAITLHSHVERGGVRLAAGPVRAQQLHEVLVQRHAPVLMILHVLLPDLPADLRRAAPEYDDAVGQVEPVPAQVAHLPAPSAGRQGHPDEQAPRRVLPRLGDDERRLVGRGRVGVRARGRGRLGLVDRVDRDPSPSDGALEGAAQDGVHDADAACRQGSALVGPARPVAVAARCVRAPGGPRALAARAVLVAHVLTCGAVLHERLPAAVVAAPP